MKKVLAVALASLFMLASVPAFACDGHGDKTAKKDSDESLMTSVDGDSEKADSNAKKTKKAKKSKEAKKDEEKKTETEGEV